MSNVLYAKSFLMAFLREVERLSRRPMLLGDYEVARTAGHRRPVLWRHPQDRLILETSEVTDHRMEIDPFATCTETLEMIVTAPTYQEAWHILTEVWRLGFHGMLVERDERSYLSAISFGRTRRPRRGEELPQGVPAGEFVFIDLVSISYLLPSQEAASGTAESLSVEVTMQDAIGNIVGETTIPEEAP
jgi:hypothetical protein